MSKSEKVVVIEYLDNSRLFDALFQNGENVDMESIDGEPVYTPDLSVATRYTPRQAEARVRSLRSQETDTGIRRIFCVSEKLAFVSEAC